MNTTPLPRRVPASHGWLWIQHAIELVRSRALMWFAFNGVVIAVSFLLLSVPLIGPPLAALIMPLLFGGLMLAAHLIARGEPLHWPVLFACFRDHAAPLVTLGGVNLLAQLLFAAIIAAWGGEHIAALSQSRVDETQATIAEEALRALAPAMFTVALLSVPLMLALWFAPPLVVFQRVGALAAMRASLAACFTNALAIFICGSITVAALMLSTLTAGWALLIVLPVAMAAVYTSYRDVFAGA